jgi:hypothetical protein
MRSHLLIGFTVLCTSALVHAQTPVLQVTVNDVGLQTMTYNGINYLAVSQSIGNVLISDGSFRAPDGTNKQYGWGNSTLDQNAFAIGDAVRSYTSNPVAFKHVYRAGLSDSVTTKITYTRIDQRTLKIDTAVTNNDKTDTLARIHFTANFLPLLLPEAANQYNQNVPMDIGPLNQWGGYPVAFLGGHWGSVAIWMGNYASSQDVFTYYGNATQTQFGFYLSNDSVNQIGHHYEDPIAPGSTKVYTIYLRFGSATDTAKSLAPEAFNLFQQSFPYLVNWPDRRPISRLFLAGQTSGENPRGYFNDPTLDVSNQTNFSYKVLAWADRSISIMNAMNPKPQGIIFWDLEGNEFNQYFTYVGNPPKLHDLAPEMDAVADKMFATFKKAGYRIGMTLRPSSFMTGIAPPATCNHSTNPDPISGVVLNDVFIKNDAVYPYRGFECSAQDTWTQPGPKLPYYQTINNDDNVILNTLEAKVAYAIQRWGATIFYVDSTVYSQGASFNFYILRQLQIDFPKVLFIPENNNLNYYGTSAPYGQGNLGDFDVPRSAREIYPNSFRVLQVSDGLNYRDSNIYSRLVQSVKNGNILFVNGWFMDGNNNYILRAYRDAKVPLPAQ